MKKKGLFICGMMFLSCGSILVSCQNDDILLSSVNEEIFNPDDAIYVLMIALAIDAQKCSRDRN